MDDDDDGMMMTGDGWMTDETDDGRYGWMVDDDETDGW